MYLNRSKNVMYLTLSSCKTKCNFISLLPMFYGASSVEYAKYKKKYKNSSENQLSIEGSGRSV